MLIGVETILMIDHWCLDCHRYYSVVCPFPTYPPPPSYLSTAPCHIGSVIVHYSDEVSTEHIQYCHGLYDPPGSRRPGWGSHRGGGLPRGDHGRCL